MATKKASDLNLVAVTSAIATEIGAHAKQVAAAIDLLSDGNTIPFIARYRKEVTGGLDEVALRAIEDLLEKATARLRPERLPCWGRSTAKGH